MKPPIPAVWRPTFGIGVALGALILLAGQASGRDSLLGLVLGGGAGILIGLNRRAEPGDG